MVNFPAVLDACVLYPMLIRDLLLRAAEAGLYRPHWSAEILDEMTRNLLSKGKYTPETAAHLVSEMTRFFPEALVNVPQSQIDAMLNESEDRHVAAAAVVSYSSVIVTANLKHFQPEHLTSWNIQAQAPDTFLTHLYDLYPKDMEQAVIYCAEDRSKPLPIPEIVNRICKRLPVFGSRLLPVLSELRVE